MQTDVAIVPLILELVWTDAVTMLYRSEKGADLRSRRMLYWLLTIGFDDSRVDAVDSVDWLRNSRLKFLLIRVDCEVSGVEMME